MSIFFQYDNDYFFKNLEGGLFRHFFECMIPCVNKNKVLVERNCEPNVGLLS